MAVSLLVDQLEQAARRGTIRTELAYGQAAVGGAVFNVLHLPDAWAPELAIAGIRIYETPFGACTCRHVAGEMWVRHRLARTWLASARERGRDIPGLRVWE